MEMQGTRQLSATQQQTWEALNDPATLKACIPGCEKFEASGDQQYAATVAVRIGPVAARFTGKVTLADMDPPNAYSLRFQAQGGVAGFGEGESRVSLTSNAEGCLLRYTVNSKVGGKIAQIGQRLIDGAAKSLAEDFFRRFDEALQARYPSAAQPADEAQLPKAQAEPMESLGVPYWGWTLGGAIVGAILVWVLSR